MKDIFMTILKNEISQKKINVLRVHYQRLKKKSKIYPKVSKRKKVIKISESKCKDGQDIETIKYY